MPSIEFPVLIVIVIAIVIVIICGIYTRLSTGSRLGANTIVRCQQGHLFTTIWVPGISIKAVRLGNMRLQRCPVGDHMTLVTPVDESELTEEERHFAYKHHDDMIP